MSGVTITVDARGFIPAERALARLDPLNQRSLLEGLARRIQIQTRNRIAEEKTSPEGKSWKPNRTGTPTLYQEGGLSRSIQYEVGASSVVVGSGLHYARIHQQGGEIRPRTAEALAFQVGGRTVFAGKVTIPARPYLGVSSRNADELVEVATDFLRRLIR